MRRDLFAFIALALGLTVASVSPAADYAPRECKAGDRVAEQNFLKNLPQSSVPGSERLDDFIDAVWFLASLQVLDTLDVNYGGLVEGEGYVLGGIAQTDNTSESIWAFSRYYEITKDPSILPYLDRSWIYVNNFPAYAEEGSSYPRTGYYRTYNCAWALLAGLKYEQVLDDVTHVAYVDSCANYLAAHTLNLEGTGDFYDRVNPPVLGFAAGSLRRYGTAKSDSLWLEKAWRRGSRVKGWIEADPTILHTEVWAMSGGVAMWGALKSYFDEFPAEESAWVSTYAPSMSTLAQPGSDENAWNAWYALGSYGLFESTAESTWRATHAGLADLLLSYDTDDDGGIPANSSTPDSLDQSWVTAYLMYCGLEKLLEEAVDAPAPEFGAGLELAAPRPNPAAGRSWLAFTLPRAAAISLEIVDVAGRRVRTLRRGPHAAGPHQAVWDGRDERGGLAASGVYFARLHAGNTLRVQRLVRLR